MEPKTKPKYKSDKPLTYDQKMVLEDVRPVTAPFCNLHASKDIDGREGVYCLECDNILYVHQSYVEVVRDKPCPLCGGRLFWITPSYQPCER